MTQDNMLEKHKKVQEEQYNDNHISERWLKLDLKFACFLIKKLMIIINSNNIELDSYTKDLAERIIARCNNL